MPLSDYTFPNTFLRLTSMTEKKSKRQYPSFYEKIVPIAIAILALVVIGMLIFTIAVAIGVVSFG
jgi:hypothetical protein